MTTRKPNIILVGLPLSGKTTVGRAAARLLGWPFVDFDTEIERRAHASVHEIFDRYGEPYFRALERELSSELAGCSGTVMSAGGGWVTDPDSVALLRQTGRIIYLRAAPSVLARRIGGSGIRRPLLQVADTVAALEALLVARGHLYEMADHVLDAEVVEKKELIEQVRRYAASL